jgi:DNA repair protein SbcC/Rad50
MRLNSLRLCNFRQHIDTRIDFDTGITGIIGPNGSGKTTILEAIAWALYGMPAARGTRESIRSYRAAARASVKVELDFELGGHRYFVTRGLTNAEVYLDGGNAPIATSISGVTDLLRRRLGMTHDEFFNTYFTGQKELSVMAAMGPAERAQFLSRVLGYERLRIAQKFIRERRNSIVAEASGLRSAMADADLVNCALADAERRLHEAQERAHDAEARRVRARRTFDGLAPRWETVQRERDALQALVAETRVTEGARASLERDSARLERDLADAAAARRELNGILVELTPFAELQSELQRLDRSCNEEARRRTLTDTLRSLDEELTRLRERRVKIDTAPALEVEATHALAQTRVALEDAQRGFEAAQTEWTRDKQEAETKRQALLDQLRDVERQREQIVALGENGICPICARPLETHFRTVLEVLDAQAESITVDGKYYRARIEQLAGIPPEVSAFDERRRQLFDEVAKHERRLARVQAAAQELGGLIRDVAAKEDRLRAVERELSTIAVTYDAARHGDVRRLVQHLTPLSVRAARLATQLEREPQLTAELAATTSRMAETEQYLAVLAAKTHSLHFSEEAFGQLREQYEGCAAELRAAELSAVAAESEVSAARGALAAADEMRGELVKHERQLGELVRDRRLHEELDRAFTDLRTELNQTLRPEISELASRFIRDLTDGRYSEIELDDQYNISVLEDGIPKPVISGGEEDLANLVLRLAISEMIAERAGQPFSLLILDEVFGSLDETRRHNVVDLLRRLQDRFEQVILITHIESVREGVDRVVAVRYDEESGTSRVETEVTPAVMPAGIQAGAAD